MARRIQVQLLDDIDGTEADETLALGLDGTEYEIDLTREHAEQLRAALAPWIQAGRRVRGTRGTKITRTELRSGGETRKQELAAMRAWAKDNGYDIATRGRVPAEVEQAWQARRS